MNWIDIAFLVVLAIGVVIGLRTGLIGAAVMALALLVGWYVAGRIAPGLGGIFDRVPAIDTLITTLLYAVVMFIAIALAERAAKFVKGLSAIATLGISTMVDRIGGAAFGLLMGFILASALLITLSRAAYDTELPGDGMAGEVVAELPEVVKTRSVIEDSISGSYVAPAVVRVYTHLPGNALGLVPGDFRVSLEALEDKIENRQ